MDDLSFRVDDLFQRRFDGIGAAILALALGTLTWALSQIGPSEARAAANAPAQPGMVLTIVAGFGIVGFAVYALWERRSQHPMTPPRLLENRAFLGLNVATLMIYTGISIVFFLLPLISSTAAPCRRPMPGWHSCPSRSAWGSCRMSSAGWPTRLARGPCSSRDRQVPRSPMSGWRWVRKNL